MKTTTIVSFMCLIYTALSAQNYRPFKEAMVNMVTVMKTD